MVQHESSDFLFDRRIKKNGRPENFFIIAILQFMKFFCHFFFDTTIKGKKYQTKNNYKFHFSDYASRLQRQW